jgi:hypothetical protein
VQGINLRVGSTLLPPLPTAGVNFSLDGAKSVYRWVTGWKSARDVNSVFIAGAVLATRLPDKITEDAVLRMYNLRPVPVEQKGTGRDKPTRVIGKGESCLSDMGVPEDTFEVGAGLFIHWEPSYLVETSANM